MALGGATGGNHIDPAVRPYGESAVLISVPSPAHARDIAERAGGHPSITDAVPAAASVLLICRTPDTQPDVVRWAHRTVAAQLETLGEQHGRLVKIPVRYDGPDLAGVATATGLTAAEIIVRHSAATYTAAFAGFAPGFVYLEGLDSALRLPRRPDPRTRVPAGAVAIAHEYTAVYPRESPGGWHLIGSTQQVMFDVDRSPPALLEPGDRVRFVAVQP